MNSLMAKIEEMSLVKRIHELEDIIDHNPKLNQLIADLKLVQKKLVNAKEFQQEKQAIEFQKKYDTLYEQVFDYPFVEEYLDLLEEANALLLNISSIIENKINSHLMD